jgi:hypothetical protein
MSIAELIMTGTERASKSTDWVADSLAKIGDNVGKVLREREQQKQAQEMLPFLQQSMQESMKLAGEGKSGEAYAKLIPFLTDASVTGNARLFPAIKAGIEMTQIAADDFLKKSQTEAYKDRYVGGGAGGGGLDVESFVDKINQGGDVTQYAEPITDQAGVNPMVAGQLPGMQIPAPQNQVGMAVARDELDQQAAAQLPVMPQGPTKEAEQAIRGVLPEIQKEPPPKNILEKFLTIEDRFAKLPFDKQQSEMDNNSIIFANQKMLEDYKPAKGRTVVKLSPSAALGIPGLTDQVELPKAIEKYSPSFNINKNGEISYNVSKKIEGDAEAKSALNWLRDWQNASIAVGSNPELRDLLTKANNDALAIDIIPSSGKDSLGRQAPAQLQIRNKPDTKIQVSDDLAKNVQMLQSQTAAANTYDAKFIRLKTVAPLQRQGQRPPIGSFFGINK